MVLRDGQDRTTEVCQSLSAAQERREQNRAHSRYAISRQSAKDAELRRRERLPSISSKFSPAGRRAATRGEKPSVSVIPILVSSLSSDWIAQLFEYSHDR